MYLIYVGEVTENFTRRKFSKKLSWRISHIHSKSTEPEPLFNKTQGQQPPPLFYSSTADFLCIWWSVSECFCYRWQRILRLLARGLHIFPVFWFCRSFLFPACSPAFVLACLACLHVRVFHVLPCFHAYVFK